MYLLEKEKHLSIWTLPTTDGAKFYFWLGREEQLTPAALLRIAESLATE